MRVAELLVGLLEGGVELLGAAGLGFDAQSPFETVSASHVLQLPEAAQGLRQDHGAEVSLVRLLAAKER